MTLDFDSRCTTAYQHRLAKIFVAIFAIVFLFPTFAGAHAVYAANQFADKLLPEPGCLFINNELHDLSLSSAKKTSAKNTGVRSTDLDVFPLEGCVTDVAEKIMTGIVSSINAQHSVKGLSDALVDLSVLVRDNVEVSTMQDDPYWNYYLSCDTWQVVFNSAPDFTGREDLSGQHDRVESQRPHLFRDLKQQYLGLEFAFIEHLKTQQLASPWNSAFTNKLHIFSPIAELINIRQFGLFGLWTNLRGRIDMASRLIFGLRFTSNAGNQFLDSLTHPIH